MTDKGEISDGYHTFNELYHHRMVLFSILCSLFKPVAWKSWLHFDGTMFDDYFIVGITTPQGNYSYHYHKDHWGMFDVPVMDRAPEWDGHVPSDIDRLLSLTTKRSPARYGYCPVCGAIGIVRERRPDGNDTCARGHQYPSVQALTEQPVAY